MKEEYDFTDAEQGKFYTPIEEIEIPIYLDNDIKSYLLQNIKEKAQDFSLNEIVIKASNKKDIL